MKSYKIIISKKMLLIITNLHNSDAKKNITNITDQQILHNAY
jgi:hypothetical protein